MITAMEELLNMQRRGLDCVASHPLRTGNPGRLGLTTVTPLGAARRCTLTRRRRPTRALGLRFAQIRPNWNSPASGAVLRLGPIRCIMAVPKAAVK